jgi:hypothetical protein
MLSTLTKTALRQIRRNAMRNLDTRCVIAAKIASFEIRVGDAGCRQEK